MQSSASKSFNLISIRPVAFVDSFFARPHLYAGVFCIVVVNLIALYLISFFYNTLYYRGLDAIIGESFGDESGITFEVARALRRGPPDPTRRVRPP